MAPSSESLLRHYRVPARKEVKLRKYDTADEFWFGKGEREKAETSLQEDVRHLVEMQRILYADARHSVLVVFQGMDTSGKDGTIRNVLGPVNPQGVKVTSFKKPTELEFSYDYLWRVHPAVPPRGKIGVFNRSHYEDILVPTVLKTFPAAEVARRYQQINDFEKYLTANGMTIVKFFLHISKQEQKERLLARLEKPHKRWKFQPGDLETRKRWNDWQKAYESILSRCSRPQAPWFVIPSDRKWYRNALVARILRMTIQKLRLKYPKPAVDLSGITIED